MPSYSFSSEQSKWTSGNSYSQVHRMISGSPVSEDGDMDEDLRSVQNGINFASRLQQFEQMQQQHRMHSKSQTQSRYNSTSSSKVCQKFIFYYFIRFIRELHFPFLKFHYFYEALALLQRNMIIQMDMRCFSKCLHNKW